MIGWLVGLSAAGGENFLPLGGRREPQASGEAHGHHVRLTARIIIIVPFWKEPSHTVRTFLIYLVISRRSVHSSRQGAKDQSHARSDMVPPSIAAQQLSSQKHQGCNKLPWEGLPMQAVIVIGARRLS